MEIGGKSKLIYGTHKIGKAYFEGTLVYQKGALPRYVKNGLVLWMDGIDKGPDNTAWVDKINGYSFANSGATFNTDHVYFDGSSSYLSASDIPRISPASGTIEVVYDIENLGTAALVYMPSSGSTAIGFGINTTPRIIWGCISTNRTTYTGFTTKASVSISNVRALCNGSALTAHATNTYWANGNTTTWIGRRNGGNYFKGKVYSIRIYNRQLSEAEVLSNLAADNARFNLGLTL